MRRRHSDSAKRGVRDQVNAWVQNSGAFDEVVDLAAAGADPGNDQRIRPELNNDGLHPNIAGYEAMSRVVDPSLFYNIMP